MKANETKAAKIASLRLRIEVGINLFNTKCRNGDADFQLFNEIKADEAQLAELEATK